MKGSWLLCIALLVPIPARAAFEGSSLEALMECGHWKQARALVERRAGTDPDDAPTAYLLSRVRLAFGDLDTALSLAQKAVFLDGGSARYHFQLARVYGDMAERAGTFKQLALARRFRREAEAAVALDGSYLEAKLGLMEYYARAPRIIGGDRDKAAELAEDIARRDASEGYLARKHLLRKGHDDAEEEALDRKAVASNPRSYEIQILLADFYASDARRRYDLSETFARAAQRLDPGQIGAYVRLARQYAAQQRFSELDAVIVSSETNDPDDLSPLFEAGQALLSSGRDLPRAERYFRRYLAQEPEAGAPALPLAHLRLGLVLRAQGRKAEAIAEIETALRLRPDLPEASEELRSLRQDAAR